MEANKTHISSETAKLLEGCGIESIYRIFDITGKGHYVFARYDMIEAKEHPTYTWQEILWEHPEKFFGEGTTQECTRRGGYITRPKTIVYGNQVLIFLQQKKYEEADLYFRKNCILIGNDKEFEEIPQMEGTMEALNNLTIIKKEVTK